MLIFAENWSIFLVEIDVAPYAGAWIETIGTILCRSGNMSLPTRERGLKPPSDAAAIPPLLSLPTRERGLKPAIKFAIVMRKVSLPTRERGLKLP